MKPKKKEYDNTYRYADFPGFTLGDSHVTEESRTEHLHVSVLGRAHPDCDDFWDGNWINCIASVRVGGFEGHSNCCLRTDELKSFHDSLSEVISKKVGIAVLTSLEDWISLKVSIDVKGRVNCRGELRDEATFANKLRFSLSFDAKFLPVTLRNLRSTLMEYPILDEAGEL